MSIQSWWKRKAVGDLARWCEYMANNGAPAKYIEFVRSSCERRNENPLKFSDEECRITAMCYAGYLAECQKSGIDTQKEWAEFQSFSIRCAGG